MSDNKRKSTPGPWRVCDEFVLAGGEGRGGRVVAMNHDRVHYECEQENEANAVLLAAAPELAEALRRLVEIVKQEEREAKRSIITEFDEDDFEQRSEHLRTAKRLLKRVGY